jgi:hypothetical protein
MRPVEHGQYAELAETYGVAQAAQQACPEDAASALSDGGDAAESISDAASTGSDISVASVLGGAASCVVAQQHEELPHCLVRPQTKVQESPVVESLHTLADSGETDDSGSDALLEIIRNMGYVAASAKDARPVLLDFDRAPWGIASAIHVSSGS